MQSFMKIKLSRNAEITLSFTNILKSWPSREFLASQICLLTLFVKIKFSRKIRIYSKCPIRMRYLISVCRFDLYFKSFNRYAE